MTYADILAEFLKRFPQYQEQICQYAPGERNCITVKLKNGTELDFTYTDDHEWTLSDRSKRAKYWKYRVN